MPKIKILFISANPNGTTQLKLGEEVREIQAKIRAAEHRDSLELITRWAVRPDDLLQALNEHKPNIVHFSGQGSPTEEIILQDKQGQPKPVRKKALVALFRTLKDNIRVVVLNACFSRPQAKAITGDIDCAIGTRRAIGDDAAITFAASFYRAIGFGRSIQDAFDQGKTALTLENIEEKTLVLLTRQTVKPESIILVNEDQEEEEDKEGLSTESRELLFTAHFDKKGTIKVSAKDGTCRIEANNLWTHKSDPENKMNKALNGLVARGLLEHIAGEFKAW